MRRVYERYATDRASRRRWDSTNVGNRYIVRERLTEAQRLIESLGLWPITGLKVLDLGCGTGSMIDALRNWGARARDVVGLDIVPDRLEIASRIHPDARLVCGDGRYLGFRDRTFKLVVASTVFSSVLDDGIAQRIAQEVNRVLDDRGVVLWYDYRVSRPGNPDTRGVSRRMIGNLFTGYDIRLRSVTLFPPVARRLSMTTDRLYPILARIPGSRTHYVGVLVKPEV